MAEVMPNADRHSSTARQVITGTNSLKMAASPPGGTEANFDANFRAGCDASSAPASRLMKNSMAEPILTTKTQRHQEKLTKFPGSHLHFLVSWCLGG
jgi:hypothetical protein